MNICDKTVAHKTVKIISVSPSVHRITSLFDTLMDSAFQGRFTPENLKNYMNEYVIRFSHRTSRNIAKILMLIVQGIITPTKISYKQVVGGVPHFIFWRT